MRRNLPAPDAIPLHLQLNAAANFLKLSPGDLSLIWGASPAEVDQVLSGALASSPDILAKAEQLVALFKVLNRFIGKAEIACSWLRNPSQAFNCKPMDMLATADGAKLVVEYLRTLHSQH
jgi:hypothetical protein